MAPGLIPRGHGPTEGTHTMIVIPITGLLVGMFGMSTFFVGMRRREYLVALVGAVLVVIGTLILTNLNMLTGGAL